MKPGWQTTEFWITLIKQVLPFLVLLGVFTLADTTKIEGAITSAIMSIGALIASSMDLWQYIKSRTEQKVATLNAQAAVAELETAKIEAKQ